MAKQKQKNNTDSGTNTSSGTNTNAINNTNKYLDKAQLLQQHQQILAKEAAAVDPAVKKKYTQQRLALEKQMGAIKQSLVKDYDNKIKDKPAKLPYLKNFLWAFCVGGAICTFGQALLMFFQNKGLDDKMAGAAVTCIIITITAVLTGLGIFDDIGRRAGAGTIVPVTGFANSIVSAALEFKHEGIVYGVGAKLFTIAGPVIVYGTAVSMIIGIIYWLKDMI